MNAQETIDTMKVAIAEVEWNYPLDYAIAFEEAIKALEKQIPEKPINVEKHYYRCPCCKQVLDVSDDDIFVYENLTPMYCSKCGQALDWSDTE